MSCSTGSLRHHLVKEHNLCESNYKKDKIYQFNAKNKNKNNDINDKDDVNNEDTSNSNNSDSYLIDC